MEITPMQFWYGLFTIVGAQIIVQLGAGWIAHRNAKMQEPLTNAQSESAMGDALEKLGQAYDRALATIESQDKELKGLRPLILDIAITKQNAAQTQLDKDDWKAHAMKLTEQLEQNKVIPIPFKRQSLNGDSDKMRAITAAQINKYIGNKEGNGNEEK